VRHACALRPRCFEPLRFGKAPLGLHLCAARWPSKEPGTDSCASREQPSASPGRLSKVSQTGRRQVTVQALLRFGTVQRWAAARSVRWARLRPRFLCRPASAAPEAAAPVGPSTKTLQALHGRVRPNRSFNADPLRQAAQAWSAAFRHHRVPGLRCLPPRSALTPTLGRKNWRRGHFSRNCAIRRESNSHERDRAANDGHAPGIRDNLGHRHQVLLRRPQLGASKSK
jgi:hypothetical protein